MAKRTTLAFGLVLALAFAAGLARAETGLWSTLWPTDVMGQSDYYSSGWRTGPLGAFFAPADLASDGSRLAVADTGNRRVLLWNAPPANGSAAAELVLGQPDFGTFARNYAGVSASSMYTPTGVCLVAGKLLVADALNSRVMIWNAVPTSNFQPCDLVLGQPDARTAGANTGGVSASSLNVPMAVWSDGERVAVADAMNNRVLAWTRFPTVDGQAADLVLGQPDFVSASLNRGGSADASTLYGPLDVHGTWGALFVTDTYNHRVLIWNAIPTLSGAAADRVLGQPDFVSVAANAGGALGLGGLNVPVRMDAIGGRVFVSENSNHRVLVWDTPLPASSAPADRVMGQPETTTNAPDCSPRNLRNPHGLARDAQRLYLVDTGNHRLLCYPPQALGEDLPPPKQEAEDEALARAFLGKGKGVSESIKDRWEAKKASK